MKMITVITAVKNKIRKAKAQKSDSIRRLACERAYGKSLAGCKTSEDINAWMLREDPYLAEMLME